MTATLTQNVNQEPGSAFKRPIAALDAGNRTTQWIDPKGNVRTIPSFVKILETWEDAEPDENSVLVELFDKHGHSETRFILGAEAQALGGKPAFEFDKIELAKYLMFATLEPNINQNTLIIECLRVALPDSRHRENVKQLGELANTYEFTRNGERCYATVRNIQPVDETKPAYRYARANSLFKSPKSINGVLDLGGGTAIARLYSPSGSVMRELDLNVPGTSSSAYPGSYQRTLPCGSCASRNLNQGDGALMTQARIVLRDAALERGEQLLKVTRLGSLTELINVMFSRYGRHLEETWEVQPVTPSYALAEPSPEIGQHAIASNLPRF